MLLEEDFSMPNQAGATPLLRSSSSRALYTSTTARTGYPRNAAQLKKLLMLNDALQLLQTCSIALVIRSWFSLLVKTEMIVGFFGVFELKFCLDLLTITHITFF